MSADNWGICPKCYQKEVGAAEAAEAAVAELYGKIEIKEWMEKHALAAAQRDMLYIYDIKRQTLREDWEIGINTEDSTFSLNYRASCAKCGFSYKFEHEEAV